VGNSSVLVTGGTGFLGRRLVERLLAEGRNVAVLARHAVPELEARGVRFVRASLDDAPAVRAACAGIEAVFHIAARVGVWGKYDDFFRTNVLGTRALLEGCRAAGVKFFVHTSTPSVVYNGQDLAGADESLPLTSSCPSPYPLTKAIAERDVLAGLEAGCAAPIGATALVDDGLLFLTATVYRPDGTERLTASHAATPDSLGSAHLQEAAHDVGARVVAELLAAGAADLAPLGESR